jgi:tRNA(His) guanylyltransferase
MKYYENQECGRRFMPLLPVLARIDGKTFSNWTRGLKRPFDERLSRTMIAVTKRLVEETGALIGYTQSDEITLAWYSSDHKSQIYFDGRILKMCSILAAYTSVWFNELIPSNIPEKIGQPAVFDCKVWQVPTLTEAANSVLWREQDATKNSIQMAAREVFSHRDLHGKNGNDQQAMLLTKDINWNDYPAFFKRGTFVQRYRTERAFTAEEIEKLPPKHAARTNPELKVKRSEIRELDMPPFGRVTNREGVIFLGELPVTGNS